MSVDSAEIQYRLQKHPMNSDLSWFSFYGIAVRTGLTYRAVCRLKTNTNGYSIVEDVNTKRKFVAQHAPLDLIPYWPDVHNKYFEDLRCVS